MEETKQQEKGITIMLPLDLWTRLKQRALDDQTTAKNIVVGMLERTLKASGGRK